MPGLTVHSVQELNVGTVHCSYSLFRSLMELANTSVEHSELDTLIESMFREAGLGRAEILSKEDFIKLLQNYKSHFDYTQIDFKGKVYRYKR